MEVASLRPFLLWSWYGNRMLMSSSADADGVVTVAESGISVTKQYAPDEFPVPAIRFEIDSSRDSPVSVRIGEEIPESFPMDAVGFHPEYHSDQWVAYQNHRVEFTGEIDPTASLVTVYGIRVDDDFDPETFLTEPEIISVQSVEAANEETPEADPTAVEEVIPQDRNEVVKTMLSGETPSVPGLDADDQEADAEIALDIDAAAERVAAGETASTDADTTTPESADTTAPDMDSPATVPADDSTSSDTSDSATESDGTPSDETSGDVETERTGTTTPEDQPGHPDEGVDPESVAHMLAIALREESLSDDDRETIRAALASESDPVSTAKVEHLQRRVEEVAAYSNALEEFLESEGTGAQLVSELRSELESVHTELDSLRSSVAGVESTVDTVEPTLSDLESRVNAVEEISESAVDDLEEVESTLDATTSRLDSLESTQQSVESSIERVESDTDAIESELTDLEESMDSSIDAVESRVDSVESSVESVDDEVQSVESTVTTVSNDIEDIQETVTGVESGLDSVSDDVDDLETSIADVESDVESIRADVTDILDWRDQLGSMFSDD